MVDYMRSRRNEGHCDNISRLFSGYPNFDICCFIHPFHDSFQKFLPPKLAEILGVMHMKFYIFDDDVLITGYF